MGRQVHRLRRPRPAIRIAITRRCRRRLESAGMWRVPALLPESFPFPSYGACSVIPVVALLSSVWSGGPRPVLLQRTVRACGRHPASASGPRLRDSSLSPSSGSVALAGRGALAAVSAGCQGGIEGKSDAAPGGQ